MISSTCYAHLLTLTTSARRRRRRRSSRSRSPGVGRTRCVLITTASDAARSRRAARFASLQWASPDASYTSFDVRKDDSSIPDEGEWSGVGGTYDTIRYDYYYYYYYLFFKPTGTKPQAIIILIPVLNSQGMKNTLHNTKKYKNQAGMNLTPPPSQNSHAVRWHCTAESERSVIIY